MEAKTIKIIAVWCRILPSCQLPDGTFKCSVGGKEEISKYCDFVYHVEGNIDNENDRDKAVSLFDKRFGEVRYLKQDGKSIRCYGLEWWEKEMVLTPEDKKRVQNMVDSFGGKDYFLQVLSQIDFS